MLTRLRHLSRFEKSCRLKKIQLKFIISVHAHQGYGRLQGRDSTQGLATVLVADGRGSAKDSDRMHATPAELNTDEITKSLIAKDLTGPSDQPNEQS